MNKTFARALDAQLAAIPAEPITPQERERLMTKEKAKFEGMALEMDAIKKIGHQLDRLPSGSATRVLDFVRDWAKSKTPVTDVPLGNNGQLPLAIDKDTFG